MQRLELVLSSEHLLVTLGDVRWLLDTGSPVSFGRQPLITLDGKPFPIAREYFGLDAASLSSLVGEQISGLIGTDILGELDLEIDLPDRNLNVSQDSIDLAGTEVELGDFMGVPVLSVESDEGEHRMFFDTGAQISYFQHESVGRFKIAGELQDFFPGMGEFRTQTHLVPFRIGPLSFEFRCGQLPDLLGLTLAMAGVEGIVGNAICVGRKVGFFARRRMMVLA